MKTLTLFIFIIIIGLTVNAQNIDLQNGLIGYWPFNGNAIDESGNGHNGSVYGATLTSDRNGNPNSAYSFNGNNSIKLSLVDPLYTKDFTVSIWANRFSCNSSYCFPISKGSSGDWHYFAIYKDMVVLSESSSNNLAINFKETVSNNKWYHYVVTRNNNVIKVYLNNTLQGIITETINLSNNYNWVIGSQNNGVTPHNFVGIIDNIRLYNRALNESEIQFIYANDNKITLDNSNIVNNIYDNNKNFDVAKNIEKKEINLIIPFNKEYSLIEKPDLSKYETSVIKKQARKGDLSSLIIYGDMFYYGYNKIKLDEVEAILKYKKAADLGNALAQYKLATIYRHDNTKVIDAVKYFNMSVEQDFEPAIYDLAILYLNGKGGVSKDYLKAKDLLNKIPTNKKAKTELAKLYLSSDIILFNLKADLKNAKILFQEASQQSIYNEWLGRLKHFGEFRYALSIMPTLLNGINIEINYKNEDQIKKLIEQINLQTDVLGNDLVKIYTYDLLNNLEVINSTISKQYEEDWYQNAINSKSISKLEEFINRFPNSNYKKTALNEIINLDNSNFDQAKKNNTAYAYQQYLNLFPFGINATDARNKIKKIEEEEIIAKEKQKEEEKLAKMKEEEDKKKAELQYEQNRKNSISNALIGDKLCFSQGWSKKENIWLFTYTTINYTMSIICFIERKEGENYQVRIADVSSSKSSEYSSPNINGVKVNKGDLIWVKPLSDKNWHKCN
jgi:hypothetical protein